MNLKDIRQYIANVIDYDPESNVDYTAQIDMIINYHYQQLFSTKAFTFAQKEESFEVYTDITYTASGIYNGATGLTQIIIQPSFVDWVEGNIIEINGVEYEVLYKDGTTGIDCYIKGNVSFVAQQVKFKNRFIRIPVDCISILQVGRRSMTIAPQSVGRYMQITRFEDEYYNFPLDEVNIPNYWIVQDDIQLFAPTSPPIVSANSTTAGKGVRTVRVAQTYVKWDQNGRTYEIETGLSPFSNPITLQDAEELRVTLPALPSDTPYARRIYIINDNDSPEFAAVYEVGSAIVGFSGPVDISFTATSFADGTFVLSQRRFEYPEGYRMTLRLYPRQSEDYDLTIRYVYRPKRLVEDTDTPDLPQSHHIVLAYACLADVLAKHDNLPLSRIYRKKYEQEVIKMEERFLTQKPRRFVKGFMKESGVDTVPMFTPLKRVP